MRRNRFMIAGVLCLSALMLVALAGCSGSATPTPTTEAASAAPANAGSPADIGKQIYFKGIGADGQPLLSSAPTASQGALMLGGGGCASCHGANGRGGKAQAGTTSIAGPDITYGSLIKAGFKDPTLKAAMLWCTDEAGLPLDDTMPCWQMTDAEANATIAYLKTLK